MAVMKSFQILVSVSFFVGVASSAPTVKVDIWGKMPDGRAVERYTLNNGWMSVQVMTLGATLTAVNVPDRNGKTDSVTLHLETLEDYLKGHPLLGLAQMGRGGMF